MPCKQIDFKNDNGPQKPTKAHSQENVGLSIQWELGNRGLGQHSNIHRPFGGLRFAVGLSLNRIACQPPDIVHCKKYLLTTFMVIKNIMILSTVSACE